MKRMRHVVSREVWILPLLALLSIGLLTMRPAQGQEAPGTDESSAAAAEDSSSEDPADPAGGDDEDSAGDGSGDEDDGGEESSGSEDTGDGDASTDDRGDPADDDGQDNGEAGGDETSEDRGEDAGQGTGEGSGDGEGSGEGEETEDEEDETDEPKPLREQTIYIPYNRIRGIFEKEGRGVFIPYEQFQSLWKQARQAAGTQPEDPEPPIDSLITEINSEAVVENEVVRTTANLQIEVLGKGWHEVDLRLGDSAIISAKLEGQPARILRNDAGGYKLLVENPRDQAQRVELELVYAKAFTKSPGRNMVSFQSPKAPVNQWRISVPQPGVKVNIQPMLAATEQPGEGEDAADQTVVLAFVGAADTVRIDWTPRSEGASGMAALATAETQQQLSVEEGIIRASTRVNYKISRAELADLQIDVPKNYKVTNVLDANVRGWNVEPEGEQLQRIHVQLFEPAKGNQSVLVELERFSQQGTAAAEMEAPAVKAVGVGRQHGLVVVRLAEGLRGDAIERTGLLQLDTAELPKSLQHAKWDFAYRFSSMPTVLRLNLQKVQPRVQASQVVEAYVEPEQITLNLSATYTVERAGIFQLAFDIPTDYEIRTVRGQTVSGGAPVVYDSRNMSAQQEGRLLVNLGAKAIGKVGVFLELQRRLDDPNLLAPTGASSALEIPLPRVAADSVEHSTGKLIVYAPESLRTNPVADGLQPISLGDATHDFQSPRGNRFPSARPVLSYAHSGQDISLTLDTQRRKPQITARQLLKTNLEAGAVKYEACFLFDILYSGVKSVRIDVPASLAPNIRNETKSIQDVRMDPQPEDVPDGYEAWSFSGEAELLGRSEITLSWEEKLTGLGVGKSTDIQLPFLQPADVDRGWGQIVIGKGETLDVRPKGEPSGLRPIDPQTDLIEGVRVEGAARGFEFHDDWSLVVTATRYELEDVKHTSIERAVLRMVVGADEQTSVQALYRMRSARQRLEVKLPPTFDPARGFNQNPLRINGRPMPLERGDAGEYYVPLADQSPDAPFVLELRYAVQSDQRQLSFPEFPNEPAVQKVYLCAYLPKDQAVIGTSGPWDNDLEDRWQRQIAGYSYQRPNDGRLVDWVTEGVSISNQPKSDFQTQGTLYAFSTVRPPKPDTGALQIRTITKDLLDAIVFLMITIPGVILVSRPMGTRVIAVGAVLFGLVFSGVFLPSLSLQLFDSSLFLALFLVASVWTLLGIIRMFRGLQPVLAGGGGGSIPPTEPPSDSANPPGSPPTVPNSPSGGPVDRSDDPAPSAVHQPVGHNQPKEKSPSSQPAEATSGATVKAVTTASAAAQSTVVLPPEGQPSPQVPERPTGMFGQDGLFSWGSRELKGPTYDGPPVKPLPASYFEQSNQPPAADSGLFGQGGLFGWSGRGGHSNG